MPFDDFDEDLQEKKEREAREQERIDNAPLYDPFTGDYLQVIRPLKMISAFSDQSVGAALALIDLALFLYDIFKDNELQNWMQN